MLFERCTNAIAPSGECLTTVGIRKRLSEEFEVRNSVGTSASLDFLDGAGDIFDALSRLFDLVGRFGGDGE